MNTVSLLLPDFLLIVIGFALYRITNWGAGFWAGAEKLVYFLLFPALLFYSTARTPLHFDTTGTMILINVFVLLCAIALTWAGKPFLKSASDTPLLYESGMQTAFRFNSYIALALASRLAGDQGAGLVSLLIGFGVPLCNVAAVHSMVQKKGSLLNELAKNPLLIATASGLLYNMLGLPMPEVFGAVLSRMGNAAIAMGLLLVGAGLRVSGMREGKWISAYFILIKLLIVPTIAYVLARYTGLPPLQLQILVLFCGLPTASSAFILAARMGGNGPLVAFQISAGTVLSALTLPFWLWLVRA
ncbi:MAG: rane transport family protein [Herbaspirillum sp.]|jgi:malonate transporter|nr:rane transport family protein [Herbaspirillum sp.]